MGQFLGTRSDLRRISAVVDERPTVCADLFKPLEAGCLPGTIIQELKQSVALLCRISPTKPDAELRDFCARFEDRYGQGWVGLCEALDPDLGVGFPAQGGNAPAPTKPADSQMAQEAGSSFHGEILRRAVSRAGVALEVALAPGDFPLGGDAGLVLPQSFAVLAAIDADSAASVRSGRYSVYLKGGVGPSGARLIARFCSGDDQLTASLATLLQRERDAEPDAVFADVVCCPEPGVGNVLWRPSLYQYEIPYLGRPGSTPDRHLHIGDLLVSVRRGEAILYSRRLQRRVIPRLATAHNFAKATLPTIYRFLSLLQAQSGRYVPSLNWGQFAKLPFLPRVRFGHVILSLAQWIIPAGDVSDAWRETGAARFAAVQRARSRLGLPRWVVAGEGDQLMAVDLNNALSVDAFVQGAKPGACLRVRELYPDRPLVTGPEGRFYHELVIPMRYQPGGERGSRTLGRPAAMNPAGRRFLPGSEWLYLKIYGGADALRCFLRARLPPLIQTLTRQGLLNNWFFVRYGDPWNHLRLRLEATSREAAKTVHALGLDAISGKLGGGNIWRIQLDTYEREIERYGGAEGIIAAEALFCADSDAALEVVSAEAAPTAPDTQLRWAAVGTDALLSDFDLTTRERASLLAALAASYQEEFAIGAAERAWLGDRFRVERWNLAPLFHGAHADFPGTAIFARRSERNRPIVEQFRRLVHTGVLALPIQALLPSLVHMHVNRLIETDWRWHELLLYDMLARWYGAQLARAASANRGHAGLRGDSNRAIGLHPANERCIPRGELSPMNGDPRRDKRPN
jgi:thiopeptide-type bacteriocin biosynthesis protein